jgi:ubiquinone/menaquinone biosynthesis C-methylase UbiE
MNNMLFRTLSRFGWFKRLNTKISNELLAKRITSSEWTFMNHGYIPNKEESVLSALNEESFERYELQMYHYLATKVSFTGKLVLEIESGRGGGARHIAETFKPVFYTGMDRAKHAVDFSNKTHSLPNLKFIQGNAEAIPLSDKCVDIVIDIESCHNYGSIDTFLHEVWRVLISGGYFLLTSYHKSEVELNALKEKLSKSGMTILDEENITENVLSAMEASKHTSSNWIENTIPEKWKNWFGEYTGVSGSKFHDSLKSGTGSYYRFLLRKK